MKVVADGYFEAERELTVERGAESRLAVSLKRDPDSPAWRRPGRFSVEVAGALALSPSLGGDVAECEMCNAGFGMGGQVVVHGGFETWRHFGFGASVGYVTVQQTITDRAAAVDVVGLDRPDLGVATDTLTLRAFQAGVWGAYRLGPERIPIRLRAGAGVLLGTVTDRRTGVFRKGGEAGGCAVKDGALTDAGCFAVGPVIETPFASFFYLAPEVRAGYRLGDHLELSVGVAALVSFGLTRPRWNGDSPLANQDHPINASPDGYGTFPSETLAGTVSVTVLPSVAVRYEL